MDQRVGWGSWLDILFNLVRICTEDNMIPIQSTWRNINPTIRIPNSSYYFCYYCCCCCSAHHNKSGWQYLGNEKSYQGFSTTKSTTFLENHAKPRIFWQYLGNKQSCCQKNEFSVPLQNQIWKMRMFLLKHAQFKLSLFGDISEKKRAMKDPLAAGGVTDFLRKKNAPKKYFFNLLVISNQRYAWDTWIEHKGWSQASPKGRQLDFYFFMECNYLNCMYLCQYILFTAG